MQCIISLPLEDHIVTISRAASTLAFPANFMLVAAMSPCLLGGLGDRWSGSDRYLPYGATMVGHRV
jgi:magnesium chelatase family protein